MSRAVDLSEREILELALSFPSLVRPLTNERTKRAEWDPELLDEWAATVASSGQLHAARFVLSIWNNDVEWKCGKFSLARAAGVWDLAHVRAFCAWSDRYRAQRGGGPPLDPHELFDECVRLKKRASRAKGALAALRMLGVEERKLVEVVGILNGLHDEDDRS